MPTPPRKLRRYDAALGRVLIPLAADLRQTLGEDLIALYLYGSAVSGGFDPGVSDVDLVAVTRPPVERLAPGALDDVHRRAVERDPSWIDRLEIVYVAHATLRMPAGPDSVAVISPGEPLHLAGPASDWLQNWYLVRETAVPLLGPPAEQIIAPISKAQFLSAVRAYLAYLRDLEPLGYAVISACRAVCTLETGAPCSKQQGAQWIWQRMPEWRWLIDTALGDRLSRGVPGFDPQTQAAARTFVELMSARWDR